MTDCGTQRECCEPGNEECTISSDPSLAGLRLPEGFTLAQCTNGGDTWSQAQPLASSVDVDADNIHDRCEYLLAHAFRPMLALNDEDRAPGREPHFSVAPIVGSTSGIKIFCALSYYRDPGSPLFYSDFEAHDGDSEFIILELHYERVGSDWSYMLDFATLSAHWNAPSGDNTARYDFTDIEYPSVYRGRPRIWVSKDKHANYRSKSVCNNMWNDICDDLQSGTTYYDTIVYEAENLGGRWWRGYAYPSENNTCFHARFMTSARCEQYWIDDYFYGWNVPTGQAVSGGYRHSVLAYQF